MIIIKSDKKKTQKFGYLKKKYYLCIEIENEMRH